jgi:hypothetical protein
LKLHGPKKEGELRCTAACHLSLGQLGITQAKFKAFERSEEKKNLL